MGEHPLPIAAHAEVDHAIEPLNQVFPVGSRRGHRLIPQGSRLGLPSPQ